MEELNKAYLFISKWVGSVNGILSLVFAGSGIALLNIFGSEYSSEVTYQILLILTVLYFFGTWVGPTGALLQMADGHKLEMYNTAIYLVLNIGFNYFFILKFGLVGAAWGTLISGFIRNILQVIEIKYFYDLNVVNRINLILLVIIIAGIVLCLLLNDYSTYIAIIFITFVILFILKSITKEETKILKTILKKYAKR